MPATEIIRSIYFRFQAIKDACIPEQPDVVYSGFLGPQEQWNQMYRAELTSAEQRMVEEQFDLTKDGCSMDTVYRLFPHKVYPIDK